MNFLLLEDGSFFLIEIDDKLVLEPTAGGSILFDPFEKPTYFYNPDKVIR